MVVRCEYCGAETSAERKTKRFCSSLCAQRKARGWPKKRNCRECGVTFEVRERADANRWHCSRQCAKRHNSKRISTWHSENPGAWRRYQENRLRKQPTYWRDKHNTDRLQIIESLGGACVVCGADNPRWLHVDFVPTSRGERYRHPRHRAYVERHPDQFRLLCANHHYELTLTGRIEGTLITQ